MRTKVSTGKKLAVTIIAFVIFLLLIVFIIWKMSALTKDILNNDNIMVSVDCVSVTGFDDNDIRKTFSSFAPDIEISDELAGKIEKSRDKFCIVKLRYNIINNTGRKISGFSMDVSAVDNTGTDVYSYSPLKPEDSDGNMFTFVQSIVMEKSQLDNKYFKDELPLNFEANLGYSFSYSMSGQTGKKTLKFTTVKRKEEIDEYELLFENEEKSDASDGDK